jgi:hypothetical protein
VELVDRYGIQMPESVTRYDLSSTVTELEFTPRYNFDTFLVELKEKDARGEVTPQSTRWWFEQGVAPPQGVVWPSQECILTGQDE